MNKRRNNKNRRKTSNVEELIFIDKSNRKPPVDGPPIPNMEDMNTTVSLSLPFMIGANCDIPLNFCLPLSASFRPSNIIENINDDKIKNIFEMIFSNMFSNSKNDPQLASTEITSLIKALAIVGINSDSDITTSDFSLVSYFAEQMGDPNSKDEYTKSYTLPLLRATLAYHLDEHDESEHILDISGFSSSGLKWKPSKPATMKIKGHMLGEPLVCPACDSIFTDPNEVMFAQNASGIPINISYDGSKDKNEIKKNAQEGKKKAFISYPSLLLTPICPKCHCNHIMENMEDLDAVNVSPVYKYPSTNEGIVPLVPKCIYDKLKNEQENTLMELNKDTISFWPKKRDGIICNTIMDAMLNKQPNQEAELQPSGNCGNSDCEYDDDDDEYDDDDDDDDDIDYI